MARKRRIQNTLRWTNRGGKVKVEKITAYRCSICDEIYEDPDEAINCCSWDKHEEVEAFRCGECDAIYEDREEAKECCKVIK